MLPKSGYWSTAVLKWPPVLLKKAPVPDSRVDSAGSVGKKRERSMSRVAVADCVAKK
jgi:hypothetical protein